MTEATGGILSGYEIQRQIECGNIRIDPPHHPWHLNPASLDLRLGSKVAVYRNTVFFYDAAGRDHSEWESSEEQLMARDGAGLGIFVGDSGRSPLDTRKKNPVHNFEMSSERGWLLKPGIGYLMHTAEKICTDTFVPVLDGKSSLGRLFMTAHVTAGYGDPGFDGQYTLEVVVTHPVIVYPGMRFCQIRFHTLVGEHSNYAKKGHYTGALAEGPVPSMSWKQFEEQGRER